jgi:hypothetical protein
MTPPLSVPEMTIRGGFWPGRSEGAAVAAMLC